MYISNNINNKRINKVYLENIRSFIERMKYVLPEECLKNMYANIKDVSIKQASKHASCSYYNCIDNKIRIINESNSLWHELLHLSSGRYDKTTLTEYNGYRITKYSKFHLGIDLDIGMGLNEGYTQLLTERYFSDRKILPDYTLEKYVAETLENVVGREKMEKLYFNADLLGLIRELQKYISNREVINFLNTLDYMSNVLAYISQCKKENKAVLRENIIAGCRNINHFLMKIEYTKNHSFSSSPIARMTICGEIYDIESKEEINEYNKKLMMKSA